MSICPPFFFFFFLCFFICVLQALSKAQISNATSTLQMEASYKLSSAVLKVRQAKMSFGLYYAYSLIIYCSLLLQQIFGSSCSTTPTDDRQSPISSSTGFLNALPTSYILYWGQSYLHSLEYSCYCSFMCLETHSILLPWVTKERNICFKSSQAIHTPIVLNYPYSTSASNLTRPLCSSSYLKLWVSISIPPSTSSIL